MTESHPKKVRSACQRCRLRRVKCDGSIPACGNCSRAGVQCVDVDSNSDQLIPRSFLVNGGARIRWLEDVIRTHLPAFDLTQGPQVDALPFSEESPGPTAVDSQPVATAASLREGGGPFAASWTAATVPLSVNPPDATGAVRPSTPSAAVPITEQTPKRPSSQISTDTADRPLRDEVRSVAIDLRLLSLNADSRQKHYLGSSSGMVFTRIIGVEEPAEASVTYTTSPNTGVSSRMSPNGTYGRRLPNQTMPSPRLGMRQPIPRSRSAILQQRAERQNLHMLHRHLQQDLPAKEETYVLLEVFFSELHMDHPIIHAPSLLRAVEALYDCIDLGPGTPVGRHGWPESIKPFSYNGEWGVDTEHIENTVTTEGVENTPISIYTAAAHVFMVLNLAATVRTRGKDFDISPTRLYKAGMACASECFSTISLASLQFLLLIAVRALMAPAEVNIWTLIHVAMAHCIDLGIHREAVVVGSGGAVAAHVRRTVFYAAYTLERSIAAIQGRPLSVRDESFDVGLPAAPLPSDTNTDSASVPATTVWSEEDVDAAAVITNLAAQSLPYSVHDFKFQRIVSDIKNALYLLPPTSSSSSPTTSSSQTHPAASRGEEATAANAAPSNYFDSSSWWMRPPLQRQESLRRQLEDWYAAVPGVVAAACPTASSTEATRLRLKLEQRYHQAMVLLHQPSQAIRQPSPEALGICFAHAAARMGNYDALYAQDSLYLGWRAVQGILSSGTIMIACFWAAAAFPGAVVLPSGPDKGFRDLAKDLRTCSGLLSASGEWWPSAKRSRDGFERMVDQTLRRHAQLMQAMASPRADANTQQQHQQQMDSSSSAGPDGRTAKVPRLTSHGPNRPLVPVSPMPVTSAVVDNLAAEEGVQDDTQVAPNALVDMREQSHHQHRQQNQHPQSVQGGIYSMDMFNMPVPVESFVASLDHNDPSWDLFVSVPGLNWFDPSVGQ